MKGENIIKRIITSPDVTPPPAVTVDVDGFCAALLVHDEPYSFELGILPRDEHTIDFTCYGDITVTDTMHLEL